MADSAERLSQLQSRAYGKTFQNVSDAPETANQALKLRSSIKALEGYQKTAVQANERLDSQEIAFQKFEDLAINAINTITRSLNDTLSPQERSTTLANQIDSFLNQAIEVANSKHNDEFLFSGYQINTKPFTLTNPNTVAALPGGMTNASFSDTLSGMQIATNQVAGGTCAGVGTHFFNAGQTSLNFSGLTIPGGSPGSCTVTVVVTSLAAGVYPNVASNLVTDQTPTPVSSRR